jgi:5-methylcytosine-specific restriction endonuclease McrA
VQILSLDKSGYPRGFITIQNAIEMIAKDKILWSLGNPIATYRGGYNNDGVRSVIETPPIIAITGTEFAKQKRFPKVILTNNSLFSRDRHICAYCGGKFMPRKLSRDHVIPVSRGGPNTWKNVVTACIPCNTKKDNRTPEEAGMKLLYVPYEPSHAEHLILKNRNITEDQMDYLSNHVSPEFLRRMTDVELFGEDK